MTFSHVAMHISPELTIEIGSAIFGVRARYDGEEGIYLLTMPMTTEQAVLGGRDTYGEPKKIAEIDFEKDGDAVRRASTRMGIPYLEAARPPRRDARAARVHRVRLLLQGAAGLRQGPALRRRSAAGAPRVAAAPRRAPALRGRARAARVALRPGRRPAGAPPRAHGVRGGHHREQRPRAAQRARRVAAALPAPALRRPGRRGHRGRRSRRGPSAMRDFAGRVAVVTGGASGIGRALGERFAARGHEARARRRRRGRRSARAVDGLEVARRRGASASHRRHAPGVGRGAGARGGRRLRPRARALQQRGRRRARGRARSGSCRSPTGAGPSRSTSSA